MWVTVESVYRNAPRANATAGWKAAYRRACAVNAEGVFFPEGEYHFYAGGTTRRFLYFSNNDAGVKSIVFAVDGRRNFSLRGDNARFVFHGRLCPMVFRNCEGLGVSGITVDFAEDFACELRVLQREEEAAWVEIGGRYRVQEGRLAFFSDPYDNVGGRLRLCAYDESTGEWGRALAGRLECANRVLEHRRGRVLLPLALGGDDRVFMLRHQGRENPAVVFDGCREVTMEDCWLCHAGGMGVLAQNSRDVSLQRVMVAPASGRKIAVTDDAVHFVECTGHLEVRGCELHDTLDDAVNIHGFYRRTRRAGNMLQLQAMHFQQFGCWWEQPGDCLEFCKADTMRPYAVQKIRTVGVYTPQVMFVEMDGECPAGYSDGDVVRNLKGGDLSAVVADNRIWNNRPRGILMTGVKKGVISGNVLHSPGAGVYLSGDMNFWYESGPNDVVEICKNTFRRCNEMEGATGKSPVTIKPEIQRTEGNFCYHNRVRIAENVFEMSAAIPAVLWRSVKSLEWKKNRVVYPRGSELSPEQQVQKL